MSDARTDRHRSLVPLHWQIAFFTVIGVVLTVLTVIRALQGHTEIWILGAILAAATLLRASALWSVRARRT